MTTSVAAAFLLSGGRNAGTPFETASTPVIAVQPFENAVRSTNVVSMPAAARGERLDGRHRDQRAGEVAPRAHAEHRQDADDEEVGRRREEAARLADAAQVAQHQDERRTRATARPVEVMLRAAPR